MDGAIEWGPLAGYFAKTQAAGVSVQPVSPEVDPPGVPFTFSISMGVRKGNVALRDELERVLQHRNRDIARVLQDYGIPRLAMPAKSSTG